MSEQEERNFLVQLVCDFDGTSAEDVARQFVEWVRDPDYVLRVKDSETGKTAEVDVYDLDLHG